MSSVMETREEKENKQQEMDTNQEVVDKSTVAKKNIDDAPVDDATAGEAAAPEEASEEPEEASGKEVEPDKADGGEETAEGEEQETEAEKPEAVEEMEEEADKTDSQTDKEAESEQPDAKKGEEKAQTETPEGEEKTADATILKRPAKRARTAYFIFTNEKRPEVQKQHPGGGVTVVAKALGQLWATLSPEEKQVYQNKAAEERERLAKEIQAWKDAGGVVPEPSSASARASTDSLIFPAARIRKIAKLDPEVKGLSKEALQLVCKASELFCSKLGKESVQTAQMQNRRKLLPDDVAQVCATREAFLFLRDDVRDLVQAQAAAAETTAAAATATTTTAKKTTSATTGSKPLTSYFAPK